MSGFDVSADFDSAAWTLVSHNPDLGTKVYHLDLGNGQIVQRTEYYMDAALVEQNKALLNESEGQGWGDGRVVARIPMSVLFDPNGLGAALQNNDDPYVKKFLNDSDNGHWRTFKGHL